MSISPRKAFGDVSLEDAGRLATDNGRYRYERRLGCGTFGTTFLSTDSQASRQVAVKLVCPGGRFERGWANMLHMQRLLHEARALSELQHACIAPYSSAFYYEVEAGLCVGAVTEFCSQGSLNDYLVAHRHLDDDKVTSFARELAYGMEFIHASGFSHRNLKPDNVLLGLFGSVKIAEFGLAKLAWEVSELLNSNCQENYSDYLLKSSPVSAAFMAPESRGNLWSEATDVFSLGLVFAAMADSERFLCSINGRSVVLPSVAKGRKCVPLGTFLSDNSSIQDDATFLLGFPSDASSRSSQTGVLFQLMNKMLVTDRAKRISMVDVRYSLERMNHSERLSYPDSSEPLQMDSSWTCCCFQ